MIFYFCFSAYNEERELPRLLARIRAAGSLLPCEFRILAYDDASHDRTQAILASEPDVILMGDDINRGLGASMARMIDHLCSEAGEGDVALFFDADNTHDPALAPEFLRVMQERSASLVIASRFLPESVMNGFPFYRRALSWLAVRLFRLILSQPVSDFSSGFRCYDIATLKRLKQKRAALISRKGFEFQIELLSAFDASTTIVEIPFTYDYTHRRGQSKMRLIKTIGYSLTLFAQLGFRK